MTSTTHPIDETIGQGLNAAEDLAATERGPAVRALVVSWTSHGRARDLAAALGGTYVVPRGNGFGVVVPLRYLVQAVATVRRIVRERPDAVIFTNPPFVAGVAVLVGARLVGATTWADCHSAAFDAERWDNWRSWSDRVLRACTGALVTNGHLAGILLERGVPAFVVNDPVLDRRRRGVPPRDAVMVTLGWAPDEPVAAMLEAFAARPELTFLLSGRPPAWAREAAPPNCVFTGWLDDAEYDATMLGALGVMCLTTREHTMQRGAYEALQRGVPAIVSGTRALRAFFGDDAFYADADAASIARACDRLVADGAAMRRRIGEALASRVAASRHELAAVPLALRPERL